MRLFIKITCGFLLAFTACQMANAQQNAVLSKQSLPVTTSLKYWLFLPDGYDSDKEKQWPILLFLHGAGERGDNLEVVKKWGPPAQAAAGEKLPFVLLAPQCPSGQRWDIDQLKQLLDHSLETLNVDSDRVYLTGLSMGGFGTWELAAQHPSMFAAIAPICGGGDPKTANSLVDLPIWAFHGDADQVVPLEKSQEMVDAVKIAGGTAAKFTVYPGVGHNSWSKTYADPKFYPWLLKQKKSK